MVVWERGRRHLRAQQDVPVLEEVVPGEAQVLALEVVADPLAVVEHHAASTHGAERHVARIELGGTRHVARVFVLRLRRGHDGVQEADVGVVGALDVESGTRRIGNRCAETGEGLHQRTLRGRRSRPRQGTTSRPATVQHEGPPSRLNSGRWQFQAPAPPLSGRVRRPSCRARLPGLLRCVPMARIR